MDRKKKLRFAQFFLLVLASLVIFLLIIGKIQI